MKTNVMARLRDKLQLPSLANNSRGMTLIEIIIVVALLAGLMALLVTNITGKADQAREDQAKIGMVSIGQGLMLYKVNNNKYPTTDQGLQALVTDPGDTKRWRGPYIETEKLKDPWGNDYTYESDGNAYKISTTSPGGRTISYPAEDESKAAEPAK